MKIFIASSKYFFEKVPPVQVELEHMGHVVTLPLGYTEPYKELEMIKLGDFAHAEFKAEMLREQVEKIKANDAVLVLNFEKDGQENYIGGATFLEVYKAWELGKKIFFYNPLPTGMLHDELTGINPKVINGNLTQIKD